MKYAKSVVLVSLSVWLNISSVQAEDALAELVTEVAQATPSMELDPDTLDEKWTEWVNAQPFSTGDYAGGVQDFQGGNIIVSSGTAYVRTRQGQPGWVESRMIAYAQADMEARARLAEFMMQALANGRRFEVQGDQDFRDGVVQDMEDISELRRTLDRWGKKTVRLTDALLDRLISLADESYDPATLNTLPPERQKVVLEELFKQAVSHTATRALSGVANVYTAENTVDNQYQVLVGILWSPKLDRVAWGIRNDSRTPLKAPSGMNINHWVANLKADLLGIWGTRVVVDEQGHYTVVAFAQAEPARTSPGLRHSAVHQAKEIAENRARAMIANFVTEKLVFRSRQGLDQIFQEREDLDSGTRITRNLQKVVQSRRQTLKISGLRTIKKWSMSHPVTGQKVAGAVVVWSPSSRDMAQRMKETMRGPRKGQAAARPEGRKAPAQTPRVIESVTIDTSAY